MNKKLLVVAVAGALAAPGFALAQASSVTISGRFLMAVQNLSHSSSPATRLNTSQTRLMDQASKIMFNITEDLGSGLSAIAQLDQRFQPDNAGSFPPPGFNPVGSGATWVGLNSKSLGKLVAGRYDLHYYYNSGIDDSFARAGTLATHSGSVMDFINGGAIANATRTQAVVAYESPTFNGLQATVAWSANPVGNSELDMINTAGAAATAQALTNGPVPGTVTLGAAGATSPVIGVTSRRKGDGWNIQPRYRNGPFFITYSYWKAKPDAPVAATNDQRSDMLGGTYTWGGLRVGLGWNKHKLTNANSGIKTAERSAWALPVSYSWGPHYIHGSYTRASNISSNVPGAVTTNNGARMVTALYAYSFSKRTSLAGAYSKLTNDAGAAYNFFSSGGFGSTDAAITAGEDARLYSIILRHIF